MSYNYSLGATSTKPTADELAPWGSNNRWVYLAAQLNRFIAGGAWDMPKPIALEGAVLHMSMFPPIWGPPLPCALGAIMLYEKRVGESGNAKELADLEALKTDADVLRYVVKNDALITRTLRAVADARGYPPAVGVATVVIPWPLIGVGVVGVFLLTRKKGRR